MDDSHTFSTGTTTAAAAAGALAGAAGEDALTFFVTAVLFATKLARSTSSASPLAIPTWLPLFPFVDDFFAAGDAVAGVGEDAAFTAAGFVTTGAACFAGVAFSAFLATLFEEADFSSAAADFPIEDESADEECSEELLFFFDFAGVELERRKRVTTAVWKREEVF